MGIGELILVVLKKYWPYIALAVVVIGFMSYLKVVKVERDHYKAKVVEVQLAYDNAVTSAKLREGVMQQKATQQTKDFNAQFLAEQNAGKAIKAERDALYAENLRKNKQLADLRLDYATVQLFNESKHTDPTKPQDPTETNTGHDSTATTVTGVDLFATIKVNDDNHIACIKVVEKWQKFWTRYVQTVNEGSN